MRENSDRFVYNDATMEHDLLELGCGLFAFTSVEISLATHEDRIQRVPSMTTSL